ncbi:MAG: nucleotide pyrophosphohydrolase, partial [Candidatus Diapherotrites archaeon]|nr:nucleotide pyrophosphohydrolase [Candidatus Diapherotrites archaeon]
MLRIRREREWDRLDNAKDLAESMILEAAELLEHFLWKKDADIAATLQDPIKREQIEDEVADILVNIICFCDYA